METAATAAQSLPPQATAETGSSNSNSNSGAVIESSLTANSPTVILGDPDEGALRVKIKGAATARVGVMRSAAAALGVQSN